MPPSLRDHVKETLAAHEPDERAARADLEAVLKRVERRRRRIWMLPAIGGPLVAAAVVLLVIGRRPPAIAPSASPPPQTAAAVPTAAATAGGVHLYLHVEGQPEDRALAIDLTVEGQPR